MAAVFLDQIGESAAVVDHVVDALVMLAELADGPEPVADVDAVRASLGVAGFFMRLGAFELAIDSGRHAFDGARHLEGVPVDPVAYSFGYTNVEAAYATSDPLRRQRYLEYVADAMEWLRCDGADDVLARFAELLRAGVGPPAAVARVGGEEFVVLCDTLPDAMPDTLPDNVCDTVGCDVAARGQSVAERVRLTIATHDWERIADGLELTVSGGVADGALSDVRRLLVEADARLLDAKRLGRNRIVARPRFVAT